MKKILLALITCLLLVSTVAAAAVYPPLLPLRVVDRRIIDANGSAVILRGVNVNQLGDYFQANPKVPSTIPLTRADFEQMASIGINSVRLIIHWSALEPRRGQFDPAYLARVKEAVGWARDNGIYVVLDMHQDAWGKYIASDPATECRAPTVPNIGWNGAPEWATVTDGRNRCMWLHREFSFAVFRAFQSFWENRDGIQDRYIATWAWVASEFKDDPTVAGYDLINEPHWGENYIRAWAKLMPAFYRKATAEIRQAEGPGKHKLVFFEPIIVWSVLPGQIPVKFTDDPDIVYAPHIYLGAISIDMYTIRREVMHPRYGFNLAKWEAAGYNTTFWNGEWLPGPGDHAWRMAQMEDEFQVGASRWVWKMSCGDPHRQSGFWPAPDRFVSGEQAESVILQCGETVDPPEGKALRINPLDAEVLGRPYPRAFPAPAQWKSDPKARTIAMSGRTERPGVPLTVWVPGQAEPEVKAAGLTPRLSQVPGGWILNAEPAGEWSLEARGRDQP